MGLSVAIVAMNEEVDIGRTLESVRWADEIVLVDSGSIDRTCEIARQYGAKVVIEPWRGYAAQKNYAIDLCTQPWVLSLDADEEIGAGLADEIRSVLGDPDALNGYWISRKHLFLNRWIRFGGFYPDPYMRLFRSGQAFVTGTDFRDHIELKKGVSQQTGRFKSALVHYAHPTLSHYLGRMNRYSSLAAETSVGKGYCGFSISDIVLRPFVNFIYNYFFRLGFLDGREGLLQHLYHAVYVSSKYAKAWELARSNSSSHTTSPT
jgi:glycosyltransferase involved in cell wall biosynthesis